MNKIACFILSVCAAFAAYGEPSTQLERDFANPPNATKPRCYWYWMDGHYSKEGITRDLEAMKRFGIGEAYIGLISGQCGIEAGEYRVLSEPFWDIMAYTIKEGGRLGVDIGVFNSPGWSQSGGPWIKSTQAMRYMATYETRVHGPIAFNGKLPGPTGPFQEILVQAFRAPRNDADTVDRHSPKVISNSASAEKLFDGDFSTVCSVEKGAVTVQLADDFTARSIIIHPAQTLNVTCDLEVSEDGVNFTKVRSFNIDRHNDAINVGPVPMAPVAVSFAPVRGRYFRFQFSSKCELGEITLSAAPRLESYAEKQLMKVFQDPQPPFDFYSWPTQVEPETPDFTINPSKVLDVSKRLSADGTLNWQVPEGDWVIVRTVAVPTGTKNAPAPPEATGLEVDKMNRTALKTHFNAYIGELLRRIPASERKAWKHVVADSYETGPQNWTDDFFSDFKKRYGYDARPYLPVLTGRLVGSANMSDRFLWDVRRMVADRVSEDYVGGLHDLCDQYGLRMWLENYGHWGFPGEFLQYGGRCHEISGEFWATGSLGSVELRDASSAAHTYGMTQVFAEAFTGGPLFTSHPYSLKPRCDWAYCEGINQYTLHLYIEQPDERKPGISAPFGTEFNRHNTWFESGSAWVDYQRRCSVMLQHGKYVADVAYFISEDTPKMTGQRVPELPAGHCFDYINAEVIEKRMQVKNGQFVLPDGMSYRVLVLPNGGTMRPALAEKIKDLVAAGGTVLGQPPVQSPSLQDYPKCDRDVARIAGELWGNCDGKTVKSRQFGKGRIFCGVDLKTVFDQLGILPDLTGVDPEKILFLHRTAPDAEIYFLCNQSSSAVDLVPSFLEAGLVPELWHPDTGKIEAPAVFDSDEKQVTMPLHLDPVGSIFVVFKKEKTHNSIVKILRNEETILAAIPAAQAPQETAVTNGGTFTMACWINPEAATPLLSEANSGVVGMGDHRNEVFFPQHGNTFGDGDSNAGAGLSVGTNGVAVYEHGNRYFVPILVYSMPIRGWTHIAVVYKNNQPSLFVNGTLVHEGLNSKRIVHPTQVNVAQGNYAGECGRIRRVARALDSDGVKNLMKTTVSESRGSAASMIEAELVDNHKLSAFVFSAGDYTFLRNDGKQFLFSVPSVSEPLKLENWTATFPADSGIAEPVSFNPLISWTEHTNPRVKYFSGSAVYKTRFDVPANFATNKESVFLDLGRVYDLAEVTLNGKNLGVLWKPPFRVPAGSALKVGENELEVRVINVWHNRLVGQKKTPESFKEAGVFQPVVLGAYGCGPNDPLFPSGMIGPVTVQSACHLSSVWE